MKLAKKLLLFDDNDQFTLAFGLALTACVGLVVRFTELVNYGMPYVTDPGVYAEWLVAISIAAIVMCIVIMIAAMYDFYVSWHEKSELELNA